ncbi:MAG TPA: helix-hairpin-helix domain-containing protein [Candidatus Sulfotelmatobacter sp.]
MKMKSSWPSLFAACLVICAASGCGPNQNPDQIRERTAEATSTVTRDAKAMAEGVKEGLNRDKTLNVNKASKEDLLTLPGITSPEADRIIAERPYASTHQLVTRRVLSEAEFEKIRDRIIASQ